MKIAGKRQLVGLCRPESGHSGDVKGKPYAQRPKVACKLRRQVGGRRSHLGVSKRADIFGTRAEGIKQVAALAHEHRASPIMQQQSIVRNHGEAVGEIEPGQYVAHLVAKGEEATLGAINKEQATHKTAKT